eukprot:CAMPEP_0114114512 /NCGR_PEP_ID=MMETSP0043_2-20121206/3473_1 /TAXON_ID=464988 /ORGANISM="Hemiselmis andersenii, Strain CCMP644" /LENGTH=178 /DNA_ID=CAMNT_0001206709 /DNA_START=84 /DNA_END=617 /DNA_ORIENTATION=+
MEKTHRIPVHHVGAQRARPASLGTIMLLCLFCPFAKSDAGCTAQRRLLALRGGAASEAVRAGSPSARGGGAGGGSSPPTAGGCAAGGGGQQDTVDDVLSGFDRETFDAVMKRRFFFAPSFQIHGGTAGIYDYGPPGCAVKDSIVRAWREHFVLEEGMLEVDSAILTPEPVLKASGHVS